MRSLLVIAFVSLMALLNEDASAAPAGCHGLEYRRFDFMIGTFTAHNQKGEVNGKSEVTTELAGCTIRMHWTGRTYEGTNNNSYDATRNVWQKAWFDNTGGVELSEGRFINGALVYRGYDYDNGRAVGIHRESWIPLRDGRVLEHYELSTDGGRSWKTAFKTYYSRVSRSAYLAQKVIQDR